MIRSMTGFARVEDEEAQGQLVIELRAVNHRYLEANLRVPDELRSFEMLLRETLHKHLNRGKIDCAVRFKPTSSNEPLRLDETRLHALIATVEHVEAAMKNPARFTALDLIRWPGVLLEEKPDQEVLGAWLTTLTERAIQQLIAMRAQEGQRLAELIATRLTQVENVVDQVRRRLPEVLLAVREKMSARLKNLELETDTHRLEQEVALIAQRLDVEEELDRLGSHTAAVRESLARKEPVGRRLDFLMQEMNREANTLGSKSADTQTTQAAVELKVVIEQMREQVQNIE
ncbi:MAG: YicC/YloC family endoribonuclease [Thiotrichales bacterium]